MCRQLESPLQCTTYIVQSSKKFIGPIFNTSDVITTASLDVIALVCPLGDLAPSSCFPPRGGCLWWMEVGSGIPLVTGVSNYRDSVGHSARSQLSYPS